jgi:hypothetical protein
MDGSPHVVRFDATTLWHFDAAERAPALERDVRSHPDSFARAGMLRWQKSANPCREHLQQLLRARSAYSITSSAVASSDNGAVQQKSSDPQRDLPVTTAQLIVTDRTR